MTNKQKLQVRRLRERRAAKPRANMPGKCQSSLTGKHAPKWIPAF